MTLLRGIVTKTGVMGKTATVTVERTVIHPILLKAFKQHKKYLVHDPLELAEPGQRVAIRLGRKVSARKSFHLDYAAPPSGGWAREVPAEMMPGQSGLAAAAQSSAGVKDRIPRDVFKA